MKEYTLETTRCPNCESVVGGIILENDMRGCMICGAKYKAIPRTISQEKYEKSIETYYGGLNAISKLFGQEPKRKLPHNNALECGLETACQG